MQEAVGIDSFCGPGNGLTSAGSPNNSHLPQGHNSGDSKSHAKRHPIGNGKNALTPLKLPVPKYSQSMILTLQLPAPIKLQEHTILPCIAAFARPKLCGYLA